MDLTCVCVCVCVCVCKKALKKRALNIRARRTSSATAVVAALHRGQTPEGATAAAARVGAWAAGGGLANRMAPSQSSVEGCAECEKKYYYFNKKKTVLG